MPAEEETELIAYIDRIIEATRAGDMLWTKVNPTTYTWATDKPRVAKLSLQRVDTRIIRGAMPVKIIKYLLQLRNEAGQEVLATDGAYSPPLNEKLRSLFETVANTVTRRGLDFLDDVLPHK